MTSWLDALLGPRGVHPLFQPIVRVGTRETLFALECLARGPRGSNLESADVLFEYVRRKGAEPQVDRACIRTLLEASGELPADLPLCLNVHASTLGRDPGFPAELEREVRRAGRSPEGIVVEIVRHAPLWSGSAFVAAVEDLRARGCRIALDDVGNAVASYKMVLDCRPDLLKLDGYFVKGSAGDTRRRAILESTVELAAAFGGEAIAEGIETEADLAVVRAAGIELCQGYLFGAASAHPALDRWNPGSGADRPDSGRPPGPDRMPLGAPAWNGDCRPRGG